MALAVTTFRKASTKWGGDFTPSEEVVKSPARMLETREVRSRALVA